MTLICMIWNNFSSWCCWEPVWVEGIFTLGLQLDQSASLLLDRGARCCINDHHRYPVWFWVSWQHSTPCYYTSNWQMLQVI